MLKTIMIYGAVLVGFGALIASTRRPWMEVPTAPAEPPQKTVTIQPTVTKYYQAGSIGIVIAIIMFRVLGIRRRYPTCTLSAVWFVMLLLYPYFVTVWEPHVASEAAWLQMQHENLTWLGGDIYTSSEYADAPLKGMVYPVDPPRAFAIFNLPLSPPWAIDQISVTDLFDWLGYTEAFCQFAKFGWVLALIGTFAILTVTCIADRETHRDRIIRAVRIMVAMGLVSVTVAWTLPFAAGWQMRQAERLTYKGQYEEALQYMERAARILPVVENDTLYISQRGLLRHLLGQHDYIEARLYRATLLEKEGRLTEAEKLFRSVLEDTDKGQLCHREATRALLRFAIHGLNSGRTNASIATLEELLNEEPNNLKANFTLQLAYLRTGRRVELTKLVLELETIYRYFQTPTKDAIVSASRANCSIAAMDADDPQSARVFFRKSQQP